MRREIKVGLTVMAAIVLLYLVLAWLKQSGIFATDAREYNVEFESVSGLLEGDDVEVRGYHAGKVLEIRPGQDAILARIQLDKNIPLYSDASAQVQIKSIMGGKKLSLLQGASGTPLASGQAIPGSADLDFGSFFSMMTELSQELSAEEIRVLIRSLNALVQNLSQLSETLDAEQVNALTSNFSESSEQLNVLLREAQEEQVITELSSAMRQFKALSPRIDSSLLAIETLATHLNDSTLSSVDQSLVQLQSLMTNASHSLDQVNTLIANDSSITGRILREKNIAVRIDSILTNFNLVLEVLKEDRLTVGVRLKKQKAKKE